jgi:hypothetical protein
MLIEELVYIGLIGCGFTGRYSTYSTAYNYS